MFRLAPVNAPTLSKPGDTVGQETARAWEGGEA